MSLGRDTVLLFYREPERDRFVRGDRHLRRALRPLLRRLRPGQAVSGFGVWFQALVRALRGAGAEVRVDDWHLAEANPGHPVGLVGSPQILDGWTLPNPAILGPGMFDHPGERPALFADKRFKGYVVTCGWMERLFRPVYGDACLRWFGAIDAEQWPDRAGGPKEFDVLVYDKIRWDRARWERELLEPVQSSLQRRGLSFRTLRYGRYRLEDYRSLLGRARALLFLCEHETQGFAYQEAMASNVPVLAWDQGRWLDPQGAKWGGGQVSASSVPYFSPECGERFLGASDFEATADRFFAQLGRYRPREYVLRELSAERSASLYLERYRALVPAERPAVHKARVRLGAVSIDPLGFSEALDAIERLVGEKRGGAVFTPNVDHVVRAERSPAFHRAYAVADLSLVDGTPLLWASRLLGRPLPEKVSGSDLLEPLVARAALRGWRVFLTGAAPGVAERAARALRLRHPSLQIAGVDGPRISDPPGEGDESEAAARRVREARADLVLVGFGSPKQELWIHRMREVLSPAVAVAVGAAIDFAAGTVARAPGLVSSAGMEWAWRLAHEPRRLWRRYLVDDPRFLAIFGAELWRAAPPGRRQ